MGRLMVITTPDLAPGFQLAGVETFAVENADQAESVLHDLLTGDAASLIVIRQRLLAAVSPALQHQARNSYEPVVIAIPGSLPTPARRRQHYISELIRRAIGFQITFGSAQAETKK